MGFYYTGERMARALRTTYLAAILRQNMAFFDLLGPGEITSRIMSDMGTVQEAVTSKLAVMLTAIATFCAAFVVAFIMYWKTALIISPFFVIMIVTETLGGAYMVRHHKRAMELYSQAAGIAEEAIAAIKHVTAFGIQTLLSQRYLSVLEQAAKADRKAENMVAGMIAWMNAMPNLIYALAFWAGSIYLTRGQMSVAEVSATTLAVTIGSFAIIRIAPSAQALLSGIAITGEILKSIARRSPQDPLVKEGDEPSTVVGDIVLDRVGLIYPSRDDVDILQDVSLRCAAMKKTAIVGSSGSGKSSILGLVERFYEPTRGTVCKYSPEPSQRPFSHLSQCWMDVISSLSTFAGCDARSPLWIRCRFCSTPPSWKIFSTGVLTWPVSGRSPNSLTGLSKHPKRPTLTTSSAPCPTATTPTSGKRACSFPEGRDSGWPSPGRSSEIRKFSCSMRQPRLSIPSPRQWSRKLWMRPPSIGPPSSLPTGYRRSRTRTTLLCWTTARLWKRAHTMPSWRRTGRMRPWYRSSRLEILMTTRPRTAHACPLRMTTMRIPATVATPSMSMRKTYERKRLPYLRPLTTKEPSGTH